MDRNTKAYRESLRTSYLPKGDTVTKIALKDGSGEAYLYTGGGRPYAMVFRGSAGRPEFHHSYRSAEHRRRHVAAFFESVNAAKQRRAAVRAHRSAFKHTLTVGTILYTSWGYDQTNVEFFVVTRVSGRRVWVREIASDFEAGGFMSGKAWPAMPIRFIGEETLHIAQPSGLEGGACVKIDDVRTAWVEQGREHYSSSYA